MSMEFFSRNLLGRSIWSTEKRWKNNMEIDLREMAYECRSWGEMAQGHVERQTVVFAMSFEIQILLP
jgi:hypothetical protein